MGARFTQTGNKAMVRLEGDLTLPYAEEIKKSFIKALIDADSVSVSFGKVENVDLSCLQLLCSAHRSGVRFNKQMAFTGDLPREMVKAAEDAGYALLKGCLKGCKQDCEITCFWMKAHGASHDR